MYKHRLVVIIVVALIIVEFILFKLLYPYANFSSDSYVYINAAAANSDVNIWPIGYSKFLRVFGTFIHNDTALVFFQYLFLEAAIFYFLFTIIELLRPVKAAVYILLCFPLLNPVFLFLANYVTSDALFTALSFVWLTQLLWMLYEFKPLYLFSHTVVLLVAFSFRYNALYYPFISAVVLLVSRQRWQMKIAAIAFIFLLPGVFVWHTSNQYYKLTGTRQFSAFGGWQLASNALFMYSHAYKHDTTPVPLRFAVLHKGVIRHMDSLSHSRNRPDAYLNDYYLWNPNNPLIQYMFSQSGTDAGALDFRIWAPIAPLQGAYGAYLIRQHPGAYARYYLLPNTINYFIPPLEDLGIYNMRKDSVKKVEQIWFDYKRQQVRSYSKDVSILYLMPVLAFIIQIIFFGTMVSFLLLKGHRKADKFFNVTLLLVMVVWIINFGFSVLASPIMLRYQLFPLVVFFSFSVLLIERIYKTAWEI